MVTYRKSKEGVAEYEKLDPPYNFYPDTPEDIAKEKYMQMTARSPTEDRFITVLKRIMAADGNEYLVYGQILERQDGIGNVHPWDNDTTEGAYQKPIPLKELKYDENNNPVRRTKSIRRVDTGYSIPFTKENCENLHKDCNDNANAPQPKTQYYVEKWNDNKTVTVLTYDDFLNGEFDDLFNHSKITTNNNNKQETSSNQIRLGGSPP